MTKFDNHVPYLAGASYGIAATALVTFAFHNPPPRFMDLYLIGIAAICGRWSKNPALFLYFLSLGFATWLLPPRGFGAPTEGYFSYRMISYSATCGVVIATIEAAKGRTR